MVYDQLKEICYRLKRSGFDHYSTRTIIAVLRFECDTKTLGSTAWVDGAERQVKLNDHHTAYYARMLIEEHPEFIDFFELRDAEGDPTCLPTLRDRLRAVMSPPPDTRTP